MRVIKTNHVFYVCNVSVHIRRASIESIESIEDKSRVPTTKPVRALPGSEHKRVQRRYDDMVV